MPERRTDQSTRDRITELEERVTARLDRIDRGYNERADTNAASIHRFAHRTTRMLAALAGLLVGLGVLNFVLNGDRIEDNERAISSIDQSRVDITFGNCRSLNERNRNTVAAFDARLDAARKSGMFSREELAEARQSREFTVGLIDALAPKTDCLKQVRDRFGPDARPSPDVLRR